MVQVAMRSMVLVMTMVLVSGILSVWKGYIGLITWVMLKLGFLLSHPVLEGKPNANHVRARIRTHVHSDYINEHHRTMLE